MWRTAPRRDKAELRPSAAEHLLRQQVHDAISPHCQMPRDDSLDDYHQAHLKEPRMTAELPRDVSLESQDVAHLHHDPFPTRMLEGPDAGESPLSELRHTKFTIAGVPGEKQAILIPDTVTLDRQLLEEICDVIRRDPPNLLLSSVSSLCHPAALTTPQLRACPAFEGLLAEARHSLDPEAEDEMSLPALLNKALASVGMQDAGVLGRRSARQVPREEAQRREKSLEDFANRVLERKTADAVSCIASAASQANAWILSGPCISTLEVLLQQGRQNGDMEAFCAVAAHAQDSAFMDSSRLSKDLMTAIFDNSHELSCESVDEQHPIALSGDLWNPARNASNREFHEYGYDYWSFDNADCAESQGHPSLQWPWPHADLLLLFFRQSPTSESRGHADWHYRTPYRFDWQSVPVDLEGLAPTGHIFIGGQTRSKRKLMQLMQSARPFLILDNTPNVAKQFATLMGIIKSALAGERRRVAPFLLDGDGGRVGPRATVLHLLQALSPSKLLKQVEREFDTSGMEPSAVLNLGDVVSILDSVKQRIRAFQQRCCVVDPLTASPLDVTSHLSAMFCGMRSDVVEGDTSPMARSLVLKAWQKHSMLTRNAVQMRQMATALEVVINLAVAFATVLSVTLVHLRLKYNRIHEEVLRGALTDEQIQDIISSFPYTRITGVLNFWMLILPIAAGVLMSLRAHFQFSQKWSTIHLVAQEVVSEIYLFLDSNRPLYVEGGMMACQGFLKRLQDIDATLSAAGIREEDLVAGDEGGCEAFDADPKLLQKHIEENVYQVEQPGWLRRKAADLLAVAGYEGLLEEGRQVHLTANAAFEPAALMTTEEYMQIRFAPLLKHYTRLIKATSSLRSRLQIVLFLLLGLCTWLAALDKPVWIPVFLVGVAVLGALMPPAESLAAINDGLAALKNVDLQWHGCSLLEQRSERMQRHVVGQTEGVSLAVASALARVPLLPSVDLLGRGGPPWQGGAEERPRSRSGCGSSRSSHSGSSRLGSRAGSRGGTPLSSQPPSAPGTPGPPRRPPRHTSRGRRA